MNHLKPQDLLVLLKAAAHPEERLSYAALGVALGMSASEVHASVRRALGSGLAVGGERGAWSPVRPTLLEFMRSGVRYVWPAVQGPVGRGIPTAYAVEPLVRQLAMGPDEVPVWADAKGRAKGPTITPLYRSAPAAALKDPALHQLLALQDALRIGRVRERKLASELLQERLLPTGYSGRLHAS